MTALDKTLSGSVDELLESHRHEPLQTWMGTVPAIAELINRTEGLELAIHRLAVEVERLAAVQERGERTAPR